MRSVLCPLANIAPLLEFAPLCMHTRNHDHRRIPVDCCRAAVFARSVLASSTHQCSCDAATISTHAVFFKCYGIARLNIFERIKIMFRDPSASASPVRANNHMVLPAMSLEPRGLRKHHLRVDDQICIANVAHTALLFSPQHLLKRKVQHRRDHEQVRVLRVRHSPRMSQRSLHKPIIVCVLERNLTNPWVHDLVQRATVASHGHPIYPTIPTVHIKLGL
mmetsp:Transcript_55904/g.170179  ORF Transcript_55904/g.170179 Transcript_55904/m.170179 type:complete len:220 (+) Transcript_55904:375-1034(+)